MSFDTEWAAMKSDASARMSLAGAENGGGGGGGPSNGQLKTSKSPWSRAAGNVGELQGNISKALTALRTKQQGSGAGAAGVAGLASAAAHAAVLQSWELRLDLIARECGELKGKLEKAGDDHYKNEQQIKGVFQQQDTKPRGQ